MLLLCELLLWINDQNEMGWPHFACVGISSKAKSEGSWFCESNQLGMDSGVGKKVGGGLLRYSIQCRQSRVSAIGRGAKYLTGICQLMNIWKTADNMGLVPATQSRNQACSYW